jgi:hypothetical protein
MRLEKRKVDWEGKKYRVACDDRYTNAERVVRICIHNIHASNLQIWMVFRLFRTVRLSTRP